jgi:hypothetical protein
VGPVGDAPPGPLPLRRYVCDSVSFANNISFDESLVTLSYQFNAAQLR